MGLMGVISPLRLGGKIFMEGEPVRASGDILRFAVGLNFPLTSVPRAGDCIL